MPSAPVDNGHPSNPMYLTDNAVSLAAGASNLSAAVDCEGFETATVFVQPAGPNCTVQVQLSMDEATWFLLVQHHDTPATALYNPGTGQVNSVRRVELGGARFIRVQTANQSAGAYTVSSWVVLQSRA